MELSALIQALEGFAPRSLAEPWDNPGLLIEPEATDIQKILVALDATPAVAEEAAAVGAQLVLTHHHLFFKPVQRIHHSAPDTAAAWRLVRHGIGLYAAHTNLDTAKGGVNDALASLLGLENIVDLKEPGTPSDLPGLGRIGDLPSPMTLTAFAKQAGELLGTCTRICGHGDTHLCKAAVVGGSGGDFYALAKAAGADVLVTGEAKHDQALSAEAANMCLIVAGHYETERPVLEPWIKGLQERLSGVQCKVEFIMAKAQHSPLYSL